jgi:hypothetical protein
MTKDERESRFNAWVAVLLGVGSVLGGGYLLAEYLMTGTVYFPKERVLLSGRGALTAPLVWIGGGVAFPIYGIRFLRRNRREVRR